MKVIIKAKAITLILSPDCCVQLMQTFITLSVKATDIHQSKFIDILCMCLWMFLIFLIKIYHLLYDV